jgi:transcription initiation factor TFIID TATA-box-binding protein
LREPVIQVQNIVASVDLEIQLDLSSLAFELPGSEYNPSRFPALIVKFREPKISFLIFRNGKINCTGANTMDTLEEGVDKLVDQLRGRGVEIEGDPGFTVTNLVATCDLGLDLNLDEMALNLENVEYEPETFPGLVYRTYGSRVSVLVFSTGKLVVAGFRDLPEGKRIVEGLVQRLEEAGLVPSHG